MSELLLKKTRKLNKILQQPGDKPVSFTQVCETLKEVLESNVYVA
ncbi:MAG: GTP-sensing pleiotropic transcriptional regulator CodY, partial [Clostridia bacterium]|nr:GTP-sensing pleiotropic transcriptional regulator CodY [Clostridia bacterium]